MSAITTHVLDTAHGTGAAGVHVELQVSEGSKWRAVADGTTDADGRLRSLTDASQPLESGVYRLVFDTGSYFNQAGSVAFHPRVTVEFTLDRAVSHYHVPLLISPFGYTTYRGT
jgi:5-hydroxyisourate hydrolase